MDFRHTVLREAALSAEMVRLFAAGEVLGAPSDPIAKLYKLDCVPSEIRLLVDNVRAQSTVLKEVRNDFENTRRRLLKKWRGDAADQFAVSSGMLLNTYYVRQADTRDTASAGEQIADGVDNVATTAAELGLRTALDVDPSSILVLAHRRNAPLEAQLAVLQALADIQQMVGVKELEVAALGSGLKDLRPPLELEI
ncbi:uncharacterized protein YukE [Nocardia sp. GAS34]|uniref:hypothetical protein n=1 Tax=unclassified Nocardia TaxID=2637762 RepID=UPI003D2523E7